MVAGHTAWADDYIPFNADKLDDMLAPIALYPDPLLARMPRAATFIDQIDERRAGSGSTGTRPRLTTSPGT